MIKNIKHLLFTRYCVRDMYITDSGIIRCRECGTEIGFTYPSVGGWSAHVYSKFQKYNIKIKNSTNKHFENKKSGGETLREWDSIVSDIKQWREDSISNAECEEEKEWEQKDCNSKEPYDVHELSKDIEYNTSE